MNKTEKIICILLGLAFFWCLWSGRNASSTAPRQPASDAPAVAAAPAAPAASAVPAAPAADSVARVEHQSPEAIVVISNEVLRIEVSTWGAAVKRAVFADYALNAGDIGEGNPPLAFDYAAAPLGALGGLAAVPADAEYEVVEHDDRHVKLVTTAGVERVWTLTGGYKVQLEERFGEGLRGATPNRLGLGAMRRGAGPNDLLSVDSWSMNAKGGEALHHADDDTPLKPLLTGKTDGGCGCGAPSALGLPAVQRGKIAGEQAWIALKDRFFATALVKSSERNTGFAAEVVRDLQSAAYQPAAISAEALYASVPPNRTAEFFVGPKKQALLWDEGMREVMDFGVWKYLCYPVVWLLNFFHDHLLPNYGVAIILLTILVRLVFWPLTRKSTEGMKKMQEIQPMLKELQAKYRDNPQRLQQETWMLYREKKVNPLSSCLPMLIQIPVFIALFNVLRSSVELRYAGFLWITDLSEPEHLFASWFPFFGGLNILPLLMALTTYLQSKLTPSAGDARQQRMMTVFMPLMMLVMFYNFASALSLYWFLSNVISIIQMAMIRRGSAPAATAVAPEVIPPAQPTRQMRRHG